MAKKANNVDTVTEALVLIGAINIGAAALGYDILDMIVGSWSTVAKVLSILIGLSGLYIVYNKVKS